MLVFQILGLSVIGGLIGMYKRERKKRMQELDTWLWDNLSYGEEFLAEKERKEREKEENNLD